MRFIINLVLMAIAIMITAYLIPGVHVGGFWNAILAGFLISLVNTFIGGILRIFTFPINFLTFGLMSFIITVLMIMLVDAMMSTFSIDGFWITALFAIVLAVIRTLMNSLLNKNPDY